MNAPVLLEMFTLDECNIVLSAALRNCDTDMIQTNYGGWKTNNCVIWNVQIISNNNVLESAPQSPPVSNRFSPLMNHVLLRLHSLNSGMWFVRVEENRQMLSVSLGLSMHSRFRYLSG